jgi:hypothetical protein
MPVNTEAIKQDLARLTEKQLEQVADFITFLKFYNQHHPQFILDPTHLANLFADENIISQSHAR